MKNKFGVEIEINSFDNRNFLKNPLRKGETPLGLDEVVQSILNLGLNACGQSWGHNHNNSKWICKPDSSCGIEICSPVFEENSMEELLCVMKLLAEDKRINVDERCSFHVHTDIGSIENIYNSKLLSYILAWWIKCEHVFIDFAVNYRKCNRYCRFIGITDLFDHEEDVSTFRAISKLSDKYLTLNTYHLFNKRRHTLEFRIGEGTKDWVFVKNWISVINNFLIAVRNADPPKNYKWLDHVEVLNFLNFSKDQKELEIWFLNRLLNNCDSQFAREKYKQILDKI